MSTEFFRKFADMITEADQAPLRKFAQNRDAERYVMKLVQQGKDIEEILADPSVRGSNLPDETVKNLWANAPDFNSGDATTRQKTQIKKLLQAGKTDEQIIASMGPDFTDTGCIRFFRNKMGEATPIQKTQVKQLVQAGKTDEQIIASMGPDFTDANWVGLQPWVKHLRYK